MSIVSPESAADVTAVPPYPATLTVAGAAWRSSLDRDGRVVLARPAVQIGRMEGNDLILCDPLVSRHHSVIRWTPGGYELEDLAAANGTYVQGRRVTGRVALSPGTEIRVGNVDLIFDALHPATRGVASGPMGAGRRPSPTRLERGGSGDAPHGAHPYYAALAAPRGGLLQALRTQLSKLYWRVFAAGLLAYFVVSAVLSATANLHLVPLQMLLASALVPVVFVVFCWDQSAFADMPLSVVGLTFLSGAIFGLTLAAVLEPLLIPVDASGTITLGMAVIIGVVEESAKVGSVWLVWWLHKRRVLSELDGLILGAAAGMGFAALETAGYGFVAFITGFDQALNTPGATAAFVVGAGIHQMNRQLVVRMALAIFGHGVWTGIVCAAIWRERRGSFLRPTGTVIFAFALAVGLHALWDWDPLAASNIAGDPSRGAVLEVGWFVAIGAVGLYVLRFFLREAVRRAKLGPQASPPVPLARSFFADASDQHTTLRVGGPR